MSTSGSWATASMVGDTWALMDGLERALDELCEVVCSKRRPGPTTAKKQPAHSGNGKHVGAPA